MAVMQSRDNRTEIAGSGGTTQFKFVTLDAGGLVTIAGSAGEQAYGVALTTVAAAAATTICVSGKVTVTAGGTVAAGEQFKPMPLVMLSLPHLVTLLWVMPRKLELTVK
jgi:hypothetical protein